MKKKSTETATGMGFYQKRAMGLKKSSMEIYDELQADIVKHAESWRVSLLKMHDDKIYSAKHKTWDDYCQAEWGFSGRHGSSLVRGEGFRVLLLGSGALTDKGRLAAEKASNSSLNAALTNGHSVGDVSNELNGSKPTRTRKPRIKPAEVDEVIPSKKCACPTCGGSGEVDADDLSSIPD